MTKNTKSSTEEQADPPAALEKLATTLQKQSAAQIESDRRFTETFRELEKNSREMESRLESKIEECYERMCAMTEKKLSKSSNSAEEQSQPYRHPNHQVSLGEEQPQPYRHPNHQVNISNSEPGHSSRNEDNAERYQVVKTRDGLLKKIDLPAFDGGDTYVWIALAERFFRIGGYDDRSKMEVVSVSLAGDVLSWFNSETHRKEFEELEGV